MYDETKGVIGYTQLVEELEERCNNPKTPLWKKRINSYLDNVLSLIKNTN